VLDLRQPGTFDLSGFEIFDFKSCYLEGLAWPDIMRDTSLLDREQMMEAMRGQALKNYDSKVKDEYLPQRVDPWSRIC
jgi:hypothetical protein